LYAKYKNGTVAKAGMNISNAFHFRSNIIFIATKTIIKAMPLVKVENLLKNIRHSNMLDIIAILLSPNDQIIILRIRRYSI
jgi:hypothetical protein